MNIKGFDFELTVDLSDQPAYEACGSHERASDTRWLRPATATIDHLGTVKVDGFKVKKNGQPYAAPMTVEYRSWGSGVDTQPEFVKQVRRMGQDFKAEALNAWETRQQF